MKMLSFKNNKLNKVIKLINDHRVNVKYSNMIIKKLLKNNKNNNKIKILLN